MTQGLCSLLDLFAHCFYYRNSLTPEAPFRLDAKGKVNGIVTSD